MIMKPAKFIGMIFMFLVVIFLFNCEDDGESSNIYNFKVMSLGGGFTGYYIVDGEDIVNFENDELASGEIYYTYEKDLDNPSSIKIRADANDDPAETQYLEIVIYRDKQEVSSESDQKNVDNHLGIYLTYDFTEDPSSE